MGMLFVSMLFSACSKEENTDQSGIKSNIKTEAATPSDGVGREKKEAASSVNKQKIIGNYVICIDPGHGFVDGGCGEGIWADGTLEKDINLAVAKKLENDLTSVGFSVIMTHDGTAQSIVGKDDGNQIFNVNERVAYANTLDIDYFISIHVNSYEKNPDTSGIRIYYEDDNNWRKVGKESDVVAKAIANSIKSEMKPSVSPVICDQEVASYGVVRETLVAASLIEIGFCTNETDAANMVNDEWQSSLAQAIADGIYTYYSDFKG